MRITRRKRHVTDYFDTCDFCDTGHSGGKIYVPYCNKTKDFWRIKFLIRLIAVFIRFVELRAKIMGWKKYALTLLLVNAVMVFVGYAILRLQSILFLNPNGISNMEPTLSFNTIISFMTNTNLQHYSGESGLSYVAQMCVIIFMMFTSAATGYAACMAFCRGLAGKKIGNFYEDMVRQGCTTTNFNSSIFYSRVIIGKPGNTTDVTRKLYN